MDKLSDGYLELCIITVLLKQAQLMSGRSEEDAMFSTNQLANQMSDDAAMDDSALLKVGT